MDRVEIIQEILENTSRLKHLVLAHTKAGSASLSRAQLEILYLLQSHEKLSVKQAADHLGVSLSAVSQLVDSLKTAGFVLREQDEKDRRIAYLSLSRQGHKAIADFRQTMSSDMRTIIGMLNDSEIATLNTIYKKLVDNAIGLTNRKAKK